MAFASMMLSACLGGFTSCSQYDLDENDPEGWGASIYNYLEVQGNYSNTLKLIDDLGLKEVLAKTGSKTLFVADDDAYARFFEKNEWGVKDYSHLSLSQKKMLLLGSMVNSSYQVKDLASVEGPVEGQSIRRLSSMSVYDTVSIVKKDSLPNMKDGDEVHNKTWKKFKNRSEVVLMRDMTVTPLTYFVEAALSNNKITNDDYAFLFNGKQEREGSDASVNGVKIEKQNIKCSNGFIHKMAEVMVPLKNMSELIASKPELSRYNKLLQRFAAPKYIGIEETRQYNYLYNKDVDSVFEQRYFSEKSHGSAYHTDDDKVVHHDLLRYDPGWNTYYNNPIPTADVAVEKDMGVMLVPTNEALDRYWNGEGRVLQDQYKSWDKVPNDVIIELLNNSMLYSFVASVPSKFNNILNDANDPMGVTKDSIQEVCLANNGAVYVTKKVYPPTSFVSVLYPAIINESLKIMRWAVEKNNYKVYLNSLNVPGGYSFFIPTNDAFLKYIDPVSYAMSQDKTKAVMYKFHYDAKLSNPVWASRFHYNMETGEVGDSIDEIRDNDYVMQRKLKEVLDNHIVIGNVEDGNTYYRTKGGQEIMVKNTAAGDKGMTVAGSLSVSNDKPAVPIDYIYDQTNGKAYIINTPIMTTPKTVLDVLEEHAEFSKFRELLEGSSLVSEDNSKKRFVGKGIKAFNTYHYTVYVPSNEAITDLQSKGQLPSWDDVQQAIDNEDMDRAEELTKVIEDFVKLHIQDYSLFIGAQPRTEEGYETAYINAKGKFERVYSTLTKDDITIKNAQTSSATGYMEAHVQKKAGLYNLQAREYLLDAEDYDVNKADLILYTSSTAVIHLIDKPLKLAK